VLAFLLATMMAGFSAFNYTESVGENFHADQAIGQWQNYDYLEKFLKTERIKFVRSSLTIYPGPNNSYSNFMNRLNADLGVQSIEIVGPNITNANQIDLLVKLRKGAAMLEGPNEPDLSAGTAWIAKTTTTDAALVSYHKSHPEIPIVAPSVSGDAPLMASSITGTVSPWFAGGFTYANMHPYTGRRPPETPGWGGVFYGASYGSLGYNIGKAAALAGPIPVISTEVGWSTADVTEATQSFYIQRATLWGFLNGVVKTILYDFVDDSEGYGLARIDGSMKPAAYGLQGLRAALYDTKPYTGDCSLSVTIKTAVPYRFLLLCKSNGEKDLVLWQPTQLQDPDTGLATPTTPADLTVNASGVSTKTVVYLETPTSRWSWQNAPLRGRIFGALTERPLILAFNAQPTMTLDALPVLGSGLINGQPITPGSAKISPNP
jgi:hypothetical protein